MLLGPAVLVAVVLRPPLLGWIGFAVVCAIVIGLAAFAAIAFPHLRVSPQQPAAAADADARVLVVADEHCGSPGLWQSIESRLAGAVAVHLVVPVRVSHLHYLTNDEASESRDAEDRVHLAVGLLRQHGVSVTGGIRSDDPLESMTDALGSFPATHVLLAMARPARTRTGWSRICSQKLRRSRHSRSATSSFPRRQHPLNPADSRQATPASPVSG